jgi:hypothetical protein
VVRVSRREWGLVEWGLEEYSGIAEEIAQRIGREGGRALLTDVVAEVARFGVRESSVRMYAEAPMFVIEGDWIRTKRAGPTDLPQRRSPTSSKSITTRSAGAERPFHAGRRSRSASSPGPR